MDAGTARTEAEAAMIRSLLEQSMDPMDVGAAVVAAIRRNAPYILTHPEFRDEVREMHAALDAAFPADQAIPPGRMAFEEHRRALLAKLRALPVKD